MLDRSSLKRFSTPRRGDVQDHDGESIGSRSCWYSCGHFWGYAILDGFRAIIRQNPLILRRNPWLYRYRPDPQLRLFGACAGCERWRCGIRKRWRVRIRKRWRVTHRRLRSLWRNRSHTEPWSGLVMARCGRPSPEPPMVAGSTARAVSRVGCGRCGRLRNLENGPSDGSRSGVCGSRRPPPFRRAGVAPTGALRHSVRWTCAMGVCWTAVVAGCRGSMMWPPTRADRRTTSASEGLGCSGGGRAEGSRGWGLGAGTLKCPSCTRIWGVGLWRGWSRGPADPGIQPKAARAGHLWPIIFDSGPWWARVPPAGARSGGPARREVRSCGARR